MAVIDYAYRVLLGAYAGALLFFGAVVAPALFRVLTPSQAGAVVREALPALEIAALGVGITCAVAAALSGGVREPRSVVRMGLLSGMVVLALCSIFAVSARMTSLRLEANDRISDLPKTDERRREFGKLHGVSTLIFGAELMLSLGALALPLRPRRPPAT